MKDIDGLNAVWEAWVPAGCAPARACIQVVHAKPAMKIEVAITAAVVNQ